jgi:hypothetical protein
LERNRVTVAEAAKRLDISESAVRKRVSRDQIEYDRDEDGRVYIYLSSRDKVADKVVDNVRDELVNELKDRVAFLQRELDDRKEESRRKDTIIVQLTQRIPAIEAPQSAAEDASQSPPSPGPTPTPPKDEERETASARPMEPTPAEASEAAQEGTERRPWWRRFFEI